MEETKNIINAKIEDVLNLAIAHPLIATVVGTAAVTIGTAKLCETIIANGIYKGNRKTLLLMARAYDVSQRL